MVKSILGFNPREFVEANTTDSSMSWGLLNHLEFYCGTFIVSFVFLNVGASLDFAETRGVSLINQQ